MVPDMQSVCKVGNLHVLRASRVIGAVFWEPLAWRSLVCLLVPAFSAVIHPSLSSSLNVQISTRLWVRGSPQRRCTDNTPALQGLAQPQWTTPALPFQSKSDRLPTVHPRPEAALGW